MPSDPVTGAGQSLPVPRYEEPSAEQRRDYLIVSPLEIARMLRSLQARTRTIAVYFGGEEDFIATRIVDVDAAGGWLSLAFGPDKQANSRVLAAKRLGIACADDDAKIEFLTARAVESSVDGQPAFRVSLPVEVLRLRRRKSQRVTVPPHGPVQILLNFEGVGNVIARVVDMSADGLGVISYPADIRLDEGEVISRCALRLPSGSALVNLRVTHSLVVTLEHGERVRHSGCQFIGKKSDLRALLERFIVALDGA